MPRHVYIGRSSLGLNLPRVEWDGGSAYYSQFAKADAAGWSSSSFFPIGVWSVRPTTAHVQAYLNIGINTAITVETSDNGPISTITNEGMYVMAVINHPHANPAENNNWTISNIGTDPKVVGWFIGDEYDMGLCGYIGSDNETGWLAAMQDRYDLITSYADGRFIWTNFGNGGGTLSSLFWAPNTRDEMAGLVDGFCVDKYAYTSPISREAIEDWGDYPGHEWPSGVSSQRSATYGWLTESARILTGLSSGVDYASKPVFPFVETKMPYINESGERIILYDELEGAIWSSIANEARGVAYFQPNGFYGNANAPTTDPNTGAAPVQGFYSLATDAVNSPDGADEGLTTRVSTINSQITTLAPVLNTQSYVWDFSASNMDTMLKVYNNNAYIFVSVGVEGTTGSKTFTLPSGITGTVATVLNESRTVNVSGGQFTDTFSNEYSHHTYRIPL